MSTIFPPGAQPGAVVNLPGKNKQYVYDGDKWELVALKDTYSNELPVVLDQTTVDGIGRTVEHSFTIEGLIDLETL